VLRQLFLLIRIAIIFTVALILLSIYASAQPALQQAESVLLLFVQTF